MKEESPRDYCSAIIQHRALLQKSTSGTRVPNMSCQLKYPKVEVPRVWNWVCLTPPQCWLILSPSALSQLTAIRSVWLRTGKGRAWGQLWGTTMIHRDNSLPKPRKLPRQSTAKLGVRRITLERGISGISYLCPEEPLLLIFSRILWAGMWIMKSEEVVSVISVKKTQIQYFSFFFLI